MEDISSQGRTIIFVSHQMPMIESLCSQSFWMQKGKINSCGITKDIVQSYLSSIYEFKENTLKNWLQRKGTGEITLANIVVRSKKLKLNDTVRIGDSAYFCFQFVCKNKSLCHNKTSFRFAINNEQNQRISTIDSRSTNLVIKHASEFKLKIKIEKINFPEGKYFITSFIGYDENAYDWIINAHSFEVISGDFFGNGRYQNIPTGEILLDHKMEVNYS